MHTGYEIQCENKPTVVHGGAGLSLLKRKSLLSQEGVFRQMGRHCQSLTMKGRTLGMGTTPKAWRMFRELALTPSVCNEADERPC